MSDSSQHASESTVKRALRAVVELREKLEALERTRREPIAVIGLGCRFPGGAESPQAFWRLLAEGRDGVTSVPGDRWDGEAFYDPDRAAPGKIVTRRGAFLAQVDGFDAHFFGIAPREAESIDPQQRLWLEVAWEAMEDAGLLPEELAGSLTGVFVGVMHHDYAWLQNADPTTIDAYAGTGTHYGIIANRLSYTLDLRGPSLAVDSACSSSLVAVHEAVQSLRRGECDLAFAGGVNLLLCPEQSISYSKWGMLSPDGRCFTFDARANGFVRGEGCGVIVLKRLTDALRDRNPIWALIRGSGVSQDGRTSVLTAPSGLAQQQVIRCALADGGVSPEQVTYVETHGTGTPLGDPIEVGALSAVYGGGERPCMLGAVKTNFGHLEGAAGIAGLIKAVLCVARGMIPPNLNFRTLNPHVHLEGSRLTLPQGLTQWSAGPRLAGVSSFGAGGTNAHVVLAEAPPRPPPTAAPLPEADPRPILLPLSAKSPDALRALAQRYSALLKEADGPTLRDIGHSAALHRAHFAHRLAGVAASRQEMSAVLEAFLRGEPHSGLSQGKTRGEDRSSLRALFVFSGHGSQWPGMGRELLATEPVFRAELERCDAAMRDQTGWSIVEQLHAESGRLVQLDVALPCLFAVQVALAALWRSVGIAPIGVSGHGIGEVAAAHVAGVLGLEDAIRVVCALGRAASSASASEGAHPPLGKALAEARPRRMEVPMHSLRTGERLQEDRLDAGYWSQILSAPDSVLPALRRLIEERFDLFLEISPHPILTPAIQRGLVQLGQEQGLSLGSLQRHTGERAALWSTLGALYVKGYALDWHRQYPEGAAFVRLPAYPWQRERYWLAASPARESLLRAKAAPSSPVLVQEAEAERPLILPLSAPTFSALRELAQAYQDALAAGSPKLSGRFADLTYSASMQQTQHRHRLALVGTGGREWRELLQAFLQDRPARGLYQGEATADSPPKLVFVFPGQGSQWVGMGRQLIEQEPIFRSAIVACDRAIRMEAGWSLLDALTDPEVQSRLARLDVVQPMLVAMSIALAALWASWGIEPDAVVGHSMGEVAAAYVAGALGLQDAMRVICTRSRLALRVAGQGMMAMVALSAPECQRALAGYEDRVSIAASNSPQATVLSGSSDALEQVLAQLQQEGVFCRPVQVDFASHSPQVEPLLDPLREALGGLRPHKSRIPIASTVTGEDAAGDELGARYWALNLRQPVRFSQSIQRLLASGHRIFVEVSPHPVLLPALEEGLRHGSQAGLAVASLRRGEDERRSLLSSLGALYVHGYEVDWKRLYPIGDPALALPTLRGLRERYEPDGPAPGSVRQARGRRGGAVGHPLLGESFTIATQPGARLWEQTWSLAQLPYLADHRVQGEVVVPGAAYIEMALAAAAQASGAAAAGWLELTIERILALPPTGARSVQAILEEHESKGASFQVFSLEGQRWVRHAVGCLGLGGDSPQTAPPEASIQELRGRCPTRMSSAEHYGKMAAWEVVYGPCFRGVQELWLGRGEALGHVRLPEAAAAQCGGYRFHPGLLDACLQVMVTPFLPARAESPAGGTYLPVGIERIWVGRQPGRDLWVHARLRPETSPGGGVLLGDLVFLAEDGQRVAEVRGLRLKQLVSSAPAPRPAPEPLYDILWRRQDLEARPEETAPARGAWLLLLDRGGTGAALQERLEERGESVVRAVPGTRYRELQPGLYEVDPSDPLSFRSLLTAAFTDRPCRGVVHLFSLDSAASSETTAATLRADQRRGCISALLLTQALLHAGWRSMPRLYLVTRAARAVIPEDRSLSIAQAPLWGLGQVMALEHPELQCTRVDLSQDFTGEELDVLLRELRCGTPEDQIALRGRRRYVARLARSTAAAAPAEVAPTSPTGERPSELRSDASYLIVGGLGGGLGLSVARWLVSQGARYLALVGRSAPTAAAGAALQEMEEAGARIAVFQIDISQPEQVAAVLADLRERFPPLRGVVHAAAVLHDRTVLKLDAESFDLAMAPKMLGAWNLHAATLDLPLDFFVLYSSMASLIGSPGQGNYAAGNAFLDALAHHRRGMGRCGLSINWGAFSEAGLAAAHASRGERLSRHGLKSMAPAEGCALLARLLQGPRAQVGAMLLDLRQWIEFHPSAAGLPFLSELVAEQAHGWPGAPGATAVREALAAARPGERLALLEDHLREQLERVLHLDRSRIDRLAPLSSWGVDSLMSLELRNCLEASLGCRLSVTLLFTYPTVAALAEYLYGKLGLAQEAELEAVPAEPEPPELSEEAVLASFDQTVDRVK